MIIFTLVLESGAGLAPTYIVDLPCTCTARLSLMSAGQLFLTVPRAGLGPKASSTFSVRAMKL